MRFFLIHALLYLLMQNLEASPILGQRISPEAFVTATKLNYHNMMKINLGDTWIETMSSRSEDIEYIYITENQIIKKMTRGYYVLQKETVFSKPLNDPEDIRINSSETTRIIYETIPDKESIVGDDTSWIKEVHRVKDNSSSNHVYLVKSNRASMLFDLTQPFYRNRISRSSKNQNSKIEYIGVRDNPLLPETIELCTLLESGLNTSSQICQEIYPEIFFNYEDSENINI